MLILKALTTVLTLMAVFALMLAMFSPKDANACGICGKVVNPDEGVCDPCLERVGRKPFGGNA